MSGALVLWRDGTIRPAHSSAAAARVKSITGACVQLRAVLAAPADLRHVGIALGHEHRTQRRERPVAATGALERDVEHDALLVELVEPQRRAAAAHEIQGEGARRRIERMSRMSTNGRPSVSTGPIRNDEP